MTLDAAKTTLTDVRGGLEQMTMGDAISIAIGLVIVAGALLALYAHWDDVGRPGIRRSSGDNNPCLLARNQSGRGLSIALLIASDWLS